MEIGIIGAIISALVAMSAAFTVEWTSKYFRKKKSGETFGERLVKLTSSLKKASIDVDNVLKEFEEIARLRGESVQRLEIEMQNLEKRETELKERIELLENTPVPVAEHFAKILESGQKRNIRRDYFLFGAGVVSTTLITIVIRVLFA